MAGRKQVAEYKIGFNVTARIFTSCCYMSCRYSKTSLPVNDPVRLELSHSVTGAALWHKIGRTAPAGSSLYQGQPTKTLMGLV